MPKRSLMSLALGCLLVPLLAAERADAASEPVLSLGSRGEAVLALDERLARLSYLRREQVSAVFDLATFHAVVAFQKHGRLVRDGIVGPQTWSALRVARRPRPLLAVSGRRVEVWLSRQLAFLVRRGVVRRTVAVSTGRRGYETPSGDFRVYRREPRSWSEPYGVWLRWAVYFERTGIAFHRSRRVPPRPASHGCVRVPPPFAREVYEFGRLRTRVVVR